jgi:asparagine synthetase B (glutamine-hydrolysing)
MAIEQPLEMMNKNVVRTALNSDLPSEILLQKDGAINYGSEMKRFQKEPELAPNKQILKEKQNQKEVGHVKVSEKAEDIPIACDGNPGCKCIYCN